MSHGDRVTKLPDGFLHHRDLAQRSLRRRRRRGPAVLRGAVPPRGRPHHSHGALLIRNFVRDIAGCTGDWSMRAFREEAIERNPRPGRLRKVLCGLSGGVDSAVARGADPRGDRRAAHLRVRRSRPVAHGRGRGSVRLVPRPLQHPPRPRRGTGPVSSASSPRHRPGGQAQDHRRLFIDVFEAEAKKIGGAAFLAQGHALSRRDRERVVHVRGPSVTIKSHHNVGGLPARMNMTLVEPLRTDCSRPEVRVLAANSSSPTPSSAVIPSRARASRSAAPARSRRRSSTPLRKADAIYPRGDPQGRPLRHDLAGLRGDPAGEDRRGDGRRGTYDHVCALRAVTSVDGMTADFYPFDMAFLGRVATRSSTRSRASTGDVRHHLEAAGHDRVGVIRFSDDPFRKSYHRPARRSSEATPPRSAIAERPPRTRRDRRAIGRQSHDPGPPPIAPVSASWSADLSRAVSRYLHGTARGALRGVIETPPPSRCEGYRPSRHIAAGCRPPYY